MFNLIDFTNDKYKLLKFLYDNQIEIKNNKYIVLSQQEIAEDLINLDYGIEEKKFENDKKVFRNKTDIEKEITKLEKKIKKLVEELDFEQAIVLRDEMLKLKELLLEF